MGFGREARRVRDETLSHGQRLRAFAYCLEWAQPVGFNASWHYLEAKTRTPRESIDFLVPAIDLLELERARHLELDQRYSILRQRQKERGARSPRPDAATPRHPVRWHGDERAAATHALRWWLQHRSLEDFVEQPDAKLAVDVARVLATGPSLTSFDLPALQRSLNWARAGVRNGSSRTGKERWLAHQVLHLLGQIYTVLNGAPVVGSPWNFTASPDDQVRRAEVARSYLRVPFWLWRSTPHDDIKWLSDAAADVLVFGYDTPALRELAGLSPGDLLHGVEPVVSVALDQLGINDLADTSIERGGFEARLVLFVQGDLTLRELSSWTHEMIGHDGDDDLQPFVELDDIYDAWEQLASIRGAAGVICSWWAWALGAARGRGGPAGLPSFSTGSFRLAPNGGVSGWSYAITGGPMAWWKTLSHNVFHAFSQGQ